MGNKCNISMNQVQGSDMWLCFMPFKAASTFFFFKIFIYIPFKFKDFFFKFKYLNFSKTVNVNLNLLIPQKNISELARKIVLNKFHSIFHMHSCMYAL